jgi:hypothetical protein
MADPFTQVITEADQKIGQQQHARAQIPDAGRQQAEALGQIADQMVRLHAEVKTLRYLFATYASRPGH